MTLPRGGSPESGCVAVGGGRRGREVFSSPACRNFCQLKQGGRRVLSFVYFYIYVCNHYIIYSFIVFLI